MGSPYCDMEVASFMSCSKGYMGECGMRGGYAEVVNMDLEVMALLQKSISAKLCPTVLGQVGSLTDWIEGCHEPLSLRRRILLLIDPVPAKVRRQQRSDCSKWCTAGLHGHSGQPAPARRAKLRLMAAAEGGRT